MARKPIQIDRDKLRAEVRKLGNEYVFYMLDDAIELLPPAKLHKIAKKYLDLKRLRPDAEQATRPSLLTERRSRKSMPSGLRRCFPATTLVNADYATTQDRSEAESCRSDCKKLRPEEAVGRFKSVALQTSGAQTGSGSTRHADDVGSLHRRCRARSLPRNYEH